MNLTSLVRISLWVTAPFNITAAYIFIFPNSTVGNLLRLPQPAFGEFYMLLAASLVGLFGVVYIWMAVQPAIERSLLCVGAAGKSLAATIAIILAVSGQLSPVTAIVLSGDYLFAGLWFYWVVTGEE